MPDQTKKAVVNMQTALTNHFSKRNEFEILGKPVLSADEEALMDDYAATLYQLGTTAFQTAQDYLAFVPISLFEIKKAHRGKSS